MNTPHELSPHPGAMSDFLRRLRWALSDLPETDRGEIIAETRSHFLDRLDQGDEAAQVAKELGSPETYGRAFLENYQISMSLASGSATRMFSVASRLTGRGAKTAFAILFFFVLYTLAGSLALVALLKPVFPDQVGLWVGPRIFMMGYLAHPGADTQQYLGFWIIPLALALSVALFRLATTLLRRFLRALSQTPRN